MKVSNSRQHITGLYDMGVMYDILLSNNTKDGVHVLVKAASCTCQACQTGYHLYLHLQYIIFAVVYNIVSELISSNTAVLAE